MTPLSITQAAAASGIPRSTIKRWCKVGAIKNARKIGNQWQLPSNWQAPHFKRGAPKKEQAK